MNYQINNYEYIKNYDRRLSQYIMLELYLPAIKFCIVQSIPGLLGFNTIANILLGIMFVLMFIRNIPIINKRSSKWILATITVLIFIYMNAFFFGGDSWNNIMNASIDILVISVTLFLTTVSIDDYNLLYDTLSRWAPIPICVAVLMMVNTAIFGVIGTATTSTNMSLSYYCLIPTLLCFYKGMEERNKFSLILFVSGLVTILFMGSRGPLLCIVLFIIFFVTKIQKLSKKTLALLSLIIVAILVYYFFGYEIIESLMLFLGKHNINSRTFQKLLSGKLFGLSERDVIAQGIIAQIHDSFWGTGFMSDLSSHNIILENVLWFGHILGTLFNCILFVLIIKTIFLPMRKNEKQGVLVLLFFSYAIPDALLNLTVWGKDYFWIYVGLLLVYSKKRNLEELYIDNVK